MITEIVSIVLIAIIVYLLYVLGIFVFSRIHKSYLWFHHLVPHRLRVENLSRSYYYGKRKKNKLYSETGMWPTIDDPVLKDVADQLNHITSKMSETSKAACILKFVQQNIVYVSDMENHGSVEYWELPVNTLATKKGDCEDSAFLCAALMHLCGLDCILIHMKGHMTVGCTAKPYLSFFKTKYKAFGKIYYRAETTTPLMPYSYNTPDTQIEGYYKIQEPTDSFRRYVSDVSS